MIDICFLLANQHFSWERHIHRDMRRDYSIFHRLLIFLQWFLFLLSVFIEENIQVTKKKNNFQKVWTHDSILNETLVSHWNKTLKSIDPGPWINSKSRCTADHSSKNSLSELCLPIPLPRGRWASMLDLFYRWVSLRKCQKTLQWFSILVIPLLESALAVLSADI